MNLGEPKPGYRVRYIGTTTPSTLAQAVYTVQAIKIYGGAKYIQVYGHERILPLLEFQIVRHFMSRLPMIEAVCAIALILVITIGLGIFYQVLIGFGACLALFAVFWLHRNAGIGWNDYAND